MAGFSGNSGQIKISQMARPVDKAPADIE